jgi:hypothetical protein
MAMMQMGEQFKVLPADAFFAAIAGMVLQTEESFGQPAAEGFGIDAEAATGVGNRENGQRIAPFAKRRKPNDREQEENTREMFQEHSRQQRAVIQREIRPRGFSRRLSWFFRVADDGNSQPNTDGCAGSGTTDRPGERRLGQRRASGLADDGPLRG